MYNDKLIRMANQIGDFFASMPNREEALQGIAKHLTKFWDPRMRRSLLLEIDNGGAQGLCAIVHESIRAHRAAIEPAPARPVQNL